MSYSYCYCYFNYYQSVLLLRSASIHLLCFFRADSLNSFDYALYHFSSLLVRSRSACFFIFWYALSFRLIGSLFVLLNWLLALVHNAVPSFCLCLYISDLHPNSLPHGHAQSLFCFVILLIITFCPCSLQVILMLARVCKLTDIYLRL